MYDDDSRLEGLAQLFQAEARARQRHAGDPEGFVRLAYMAKSALDRTRGVGNRYSASLVDLCDALEGSGMPQIANPEKTTLPECYLMAARILQAAALEDLRDA